MNSKPPLILLEIAYHWNVYVKIIMLNSVQDKQKNKQSLEGYMKKRIWFLDFFYCGQR